MRDAELRRMAISQSAKEAADQMPSRRNKVYSSPAAALSDLSSNTVVLVSGFAGVGWPEALLKALHSRGENLLTLVCQGVWLDHLDSSPVAGGIQSLVADGRVAKLISPLPFYPGNGGIVEEKWNSGELELEVIPQGVLAEQLRAGGAGLGGIFLPAAANTRFDDSKEVRSIGGRHHVFQPSLRADFALLRAKAADTMGNLVYQATQRNWNPFMAMAARVSIVEVDEVFELGGLDPELVITPGIFVDRIVQTV